MSDDKTTFLETAYTKASVFLRDVFQYFFCGVFFIVLLFILVRLKGYKIDEIHIGILQSTWKGFSLIWLLIFLTVCYLLGHILFSLSTFIFTMYKFIFKKLRCRSVKKLDKKKQKLCDILQETQERSKGGIKSLYEDLPEHLYFEMMVFIHRRDLHGRFIERYNLITNMRQVLCSCFFVSGLIYTFLPPIEGYSIVVGAVLFVSSVLFYFQTVKGQTGFLNRVITSYIILREEQS